MHIFTITSKWIYDLKNMLMNMLYRRSSRGEDPTLLGMGAGTGSGSISGLFSKVNFFYFLLFTWSCTFIFLLHVIGLSSLNLISLSFYGLSNKYHILFLFFSCLLLQSILGDTGVCAEHAYKKIKLVLDFSALPRVTQKKNTTI
jgi:hypothetical protein